MQPSVCLIDFRDEVIHPRYRLVNSGQNTKTFLCRNIEIIPSFTLDNERRPSLLLPVSKEAAASRKRLCLVDFGVVYDNLKIDEITSAIRVGSAVTPSEEDDTVNDSKIAAKLRANLKKFLGELSPHFSKPKLAFLGDMIYGLLAGGDVKLSESCSNILI